MSTASAVAPSMSNAMLKCVNSASWQSSNQTLACQVAFLHTPKCLVVDFITFAFSERFFSMISVTTHVMNPCKSYKNILVNLNYDT